MINFKFTINYGIRLKQKTTLVFNKLYTLKNGSIILQQICFDLDLKHYQQFQFLNIYKFNYQSLC